MLKAPDDPNRITRGMYNVPRNAWYAVAGMEEVGEKLLARRVMDIPLVLYRTVAGEPVALHDRCPHRLMPLSVGHKLGDEIQCLYHGMQFGPSGACSKIPTQKSIPSKMAVRRYPVVDRFPFTWIWMGDAGRADPALIPVTDRIKTGYSHFFQLCYPIKSDFMLMVENLMDTSHPTFLHAGYFDDGQLIGAQVKVETEGNVVRLIRDVGVHVPGPGTTAFYRLDPGKPVHQVTIAEMIAPSLNIIHYQFRYLDQPARPVTDYIVLAPITPSGPRACYHFVASAYSWPQESTPELMDLLREIIKGDQLALEGIEERRDELGAGEGEIHIRADLAALRVRQMIRSMAEAERQQDGKVLSAVSN